MNLVYATGAQRSGRQVSMAKELWACNASDAWVQALKKVPQARVSLKSKTFVEQDRWYCEELPACLSRAPPHITKEEIVKLVEWKLARGKWRPRLLDYAKQQSEEQVALVTEAALKVLKGCDPADLQAFKTALEILTQLKGVGPATASAILAAACAHSPFMSDEALEAALGNRNVYTVQAYMALTTALQSKANLLNSSQAESGPDAATATSSPLQGQGSAAASGEASPSCTWTASLVEKALWAAAVVGTSAAVGDKNAAPAKAPSKQAGAAKAAEKTGRSAPAKRSRKG